MKIKSAEEIYRYAYVAACKRKTGGSPTMGASYEASRGKKVSDIVKAIQDGEMTPEDIKKAEEEYGRAHGFV